MKRLRRFSNPLSLVGTAPPCPRRRSYPPTGTIRLRRFLAVAICRGVATRHSDYLFA
jgi:hypothetical protein